MSGWIGVDLDGTLAHYEGWDDGKIGVPVPKMLARVTQWLAEGRDVRIVTARVWWDRDLGTGSARNADFGRVSEERRKIQAWCVKHIGRALPVTCEKDYAMICLYDDRCKQVVPNTGEIVGGDE